MKKAITKLSLAGNIEMLRRIIAECKQRLMKGRPIESFPHYWALIPVNPERKVYHKKNIDQ